MSFIGVVLLVLGFYVLIGVFVAIRFLVRIAPSIDDAFRGAPWRVRLLFLPGAIAIWPMVLTRSAALLNYSSGDTG